ncbi:unannotated protein [freshwater metagenome]|uniref:Unannotated protein n=1 Tax=freshwater metagenome TaxID=449393 RepID=A0A6J6DZ38_9ZZZZ|nr:hypothetical protein [Actinomycetota bacterium]
MDEVERIQRQAALVRSWLESPEALRTANAVAGRLRLDCDGSDLVQQAWLRVTTSFAARTTALVDLHGPVEAARYGSRVVSNIGLDRLRSMARTEVVALDRVETHLADDRLDPERGAMAMSFFEELLRRIPVTETRGNNCGGCSVDTIRSIAITVVQTFALETKAGGPDGPVDGRERLERLVDRAIESFGETGESARLRKRRSRCKHCVRDLLARVLDDMEVRRD